MSNGKQRVFSNVQYYLLKFIQYYHTEFETIVTFTQFGVLFRISAVRITLYKHCIITSSLWYGFTWLYIEKKNNTGVKAIPTCEWLHWKDPSYWPTMVRSSLWWSPLMSFETTGSRVFWYIWLNICSTGAGKKFLRAFL